MRIPRKLVPTLLVAALTLGLAACENKNKQEVATQVAAKVGSEEISVHQINQVLRHANTNAPQTMGPEVLEKLIDQQLAISQAIAQKLDRAPDVVADIEAARRDIVARAYLKQITSGLTPSSAADVQKYYAEHPALFTERRIFNIEEIVTPNTTVTEAQLTRLATDAKSIAEVSDWLKSKNIQFTGGNTTRTAEQLPLELLAKVHALKDGQSTILTSPKTITYLRIASSQRAPLAEAVALPRIEQFLNNQLAAQAIATKLKELRANAKISYMGEFAKIDAPKSPATAATPTGNTP